MMLDYIRKYKILVGLPLLVLLLLFCFLAAINPSPGHAVGLGFAFCAFLASAALGIVAGIE